jgi:sugar lactone lactonase YvrE
MHFMGAIRVWVPLLTAAMLSLPAASSSISVAAGPEQIRMNEPFAVAFGRGGEWFILEHKGRRIVHVSKDGKFTPFAGAEAAIRAGFNDPHGLLATRDGSALYVADTLNHQIHRIDLRSRTIALVAGTGEKGYSGDNGPALKATFNGTFAAALDPGETTLYVADLGNRRIRAINLKTGIVITVAGDAGNPLVDPRAVAVDSKGVVYILERGGNALRALDRKGGMRTLIAPNQTTPPLKGPKHLCLDLDDNVIIADTENHIIRRFNPRDGSMATIAGSGAKGSHVDPADPLKTDLNRPHGVAFSPSGDLYISDSDNHRILKLSR